MTIKAWQHIYTNVERDQSPHGRSGFQTLCYSRAGLSQADVEEIEERVFYVYGSPNPVKYVFFSLKSGKIAIGRVAAIAGRDAAGREGLYIAHTLIIEAKAFQDAGFNPTQLFESDLFAASLEEAFALVNSKDGNSAGDIKSVEIEAKPLPTPGSSWQMESFRRLVQLAINHQMVADKKSAVALTGSPAEIQHALANLFSMLPQEIIAACSFDTFFERGGNLRFTYCWAAGFSERPRQPIYIFVDVDKQHIPEPADFAETFIQPQSAYGRWIDQALTTARSGAALPNITRQKETAFLVGTFIDGRHKDIDAVLEADESVVVSVIQANEEPVKARIMAQITHACPQPLAGKILQLLYPDLSLEQRIRAMIAPTDTGVLLRYLFAAYERAGFTSPEKEERQALSDVLKDHRHEGLESLLLIWGGGTWTNPVKSWRIRSGVTEMDGETYKRFWQLAVNNNLVDMMDLMVDGKEALFTYLAGEAGIKDLDEVPKIIKTLVGTQTLEALDALAPYLERLDSKNLKKVRKYTRGLAGIPPGFKHALDALP